MIGPQPRFVVEEVPSDLEAGYHPAGLVVVDLLRNVALGDSDEYRDDLQTLARRYNADSASAPTC